MDVTNLRTVLTHHEEAVRRESFLRKLIPLNVDTSLLTAPKKFGSLEGHVRMIKEKDEKLFQMGRCCTAKMFSRLIAYLYWTVSFLKLILASLNLVE